MKLLVTGGAGFIGSAFVLRYLKKYPNDRVTNLDALTYAGNLKNIASAMDDPRHTFIKGDIRNPADVAKAMEGAEAVVHFAAESHVDRSIHDASDFLTTNVNGTVVLLEAARKTGVKKFVHVSTDEVYGSIAEGMFTESDKLNPSSPYSASKASSDLLALSYHITHDLPVTVTRCSNNFGPRQFPEKLIPLFITNAVTDQPLPVYGDGLNVRDWIYVDDHASAIDAVLHGGKAGEIYNVAGGNERNNLQITDGILAKLGKPQSLKRFIDDRPAHDRRYAIDDTKLRTELGWSPEHNFDTALSATIDWYVANEEWWRDIKSGAYLSFYETLYANRLKKAVEDGTR